MGGACPSAVDLWANHTPAYHLNGTCSEQFDLSQPNPCPCTCPCIWIYFNDGGELLGAGTYGGYTFTEEAVRIITDHDQSAAPLAMYIAFLNIHPPLQVPQNYVEMQRNVSACPGHLCSEPSKVKENAYISFCDAILY